jgi:hypothetical protein
MPSGVVLAGDTSIPWRREVDQLLWLSHRNLAFQIGCFRFEPYAIRSVV